MMLLKLKWFKSEEGTLGVFSLLKYVFQQSFNTYVLDNNII